MGWLHNVTSKPALCCGSRLKKQEETCCMSEDKQLLYSTVDGLQCCGHLYYNSSLWSCCSGKLSPRQQPLPGNTIQTSEFSVLSLNNIQKHNLCKNIILGIVESVSQHSIVINNVMKVRVSYPRARRYVKTKTMTDDCSVPELTVGTAYLFDGTNFYANLDHKFIHEALYFILSMCQG